MTKENVGSFETDLTGQDIRTRNLFTEEVQLSIKDKVVSTEGFSTGGKQLYVVFIADDEWIKEQYKKHNHSEIAEQPPTPYMGRRIGNTTRLADYYIQRLFTGETVEIKDHREQEYSSSREGLLKMISDRLKREHGLTLQYNFSGRMLSSSVMMKDAKYFIKELQK